MKRCASKWLNGAQNSLLLGSGGPIKSCCALWAARCVQHFPCETSHGYVTKDTVVPLGIAQLHYRITAILQNKPQWVFELIRLYTLSDTEEDKQAGKNQDGVWWRSCMPFSDHITPAATGDFLKSPTQIRIPLPSFPSMLSSTTLPLPFLPSISHTLLPLFPLPPGGRRQH